MTVGLAPGSLSFTIDPDVSPSTGTIQIEVRTNDPPTLFSIGLVSGGAGPSFSYRLVGIGEDDIPILPNVSSQDLPNFGHTTYTLEFTATAGPDLSAGTYHAVAQLQFQGAGTIRMFALPLDVTVLARAPAVDAGPDQTVDEGEVVAFTGSFFDPDIGETYTIGWDFGDANAASGTLSPTHTYLDDGTYTVTLTVTDSGGRTGQDTLTVVVNDLGPTAHVESVPPVTPPFVLTVDAGEEVTFDASGSTSSPDAIVSYEWDWDYGGLEGFMPSGETGSVVTHVFPVAGTYTVAVRVRDDDGSTDVATLDVVVNPVTTAEARLATPEVAGGAAALEIPMLEIDELYVHREALAVSQFHLVRPEAPALPSNPVIYFPFDEGDGQYVYNEVDEDSGKARVLRGTIYKAEWVEGEWVQGNASALGLGEDGYVEIPPDPRMDFPWSQDFTLEFWVRTNDSTGERTLVRRERSEHGSLYGLNLFGGVPLFYISTAADRYVFVKGKSNIADGNWHHIACVRENGTLKLYVDGALIDELAPEAGIAGAGGADLGSREPVYLGGRVREPIGGLVDAVYYVGEPMVFRLRITDETGSPVTDASPSLLFIRYDNAGRKLASGLIGRLDYDPEAEEYTYSLDTSPYKEGIYEFFLVPGDGSQELLRIMLLEVE